MGDLLFEPAVEATQNRRERREFEQKVTKKTKVRNLRGVLAERRTLDSSRSG
jgi:hypothetical protein